MMIPNLASDFQFSKILTMTAGAELPEMNCNEMIY
jgi:hypothetical protein